MSTALTGETISRPTHATPNYPEGMRVPINIDPGVRTNLLDLLYQPWMRGVGYSEFIQRAIDRAYEEADEHGLS